MPVPVDLLPWLHCDLLISVACCDYSGAPLLSRALAIRSSNDGEEVTVYVHGGAARILLGQLHQGVIISVVCEEPCTHRSLQLKGALRELRRLTDPDRQWCRDYRQSFIDSIGRFGFPADQAAVFIPEADTDAMALVCPASEVYIQTPGQLAGQPLPAAGALP